MKMLLERLHHPRMTFSQRILPTEFVIRGPVANLPDCRAGPTNPKIWLPISARSFRLLIRPEIERLKKKANSSPTNVAPSARFEIEQNTNRTGFRNSRLHPDQQRSNQGDYATLHKLKRRKKL